MLSLELTRKDFDCSRILQSFVYMSSPSGVLNCNIKELSEMSGFDTDYILSCIYYLSENKYIESFEIVKNEIYIILDKTFIFLNTITLINKAK